MKNQAINLGRIGILLPIAMIIPFIGSLVGLAAAVLLVMSHHYFSKTFEKPTLFKNALTGTIIIIGGNILGGILILIGVGSAALSGTAQNMDPENIQRLFTLIFESGLTIVGGLLMFAALIIGYIFIFKALKELAATSGIKHFKTAGILYLIGAITLVIFGLGGLLILIGWIIHIVAYFSIQPEPKEVV